MFWLREIRIKKQDKNGNMECHNDVFEVKKEKIANIVKETKKHSLNIVGLSDVKWKKSGYYYFEEYSCISVGEGKWEHRVAIILDKELARRVVNIEQEHWDRLIKIEKEAYPRTIWQLSNCTCQQKTAMTKR